ncbi:MAG TPA: ThiF family adenylyltransferase [Micromonosporaceae bacterium]|nr:ThiF family adenylyltransferase [Micromonosporaceae bacterium]
MRPRLKDVFWERYGAELGLVFDAREQVRLDDPDGAVELLLDLMRKGSRTPPELADVVGVPLHAVDRIIAELDAHRLLVDDDRAGRIGTDASERYADNLAFFDRYATLAVGREDMQERVHAAHVLVLGLGGVNTTVVGHLCGFGVDRLTLVDAGTIGVRDLARQQLARWRDVGTRTARRAAVWVRDIDPSMQVDAVDVGVGDAAAFGAVLDRFCPDIVVADVDGTVDVDLWVNAACVARNVPFIRAATKQTTATVYSVDPGRSACVACAAGTSVGQSPDVLRLLRERPAAGLGMGPVSGMLASLAALEILRYVTGYEPPAYAGQPMRIEFGAGTDMRRLAWRRDTACGTCAPAQRRSA